MLPRRIQTIAKTFDIGTGDFVAISKTHAEATAFDFYGNDRDPETDARFEQAVWLVTRDMRNGEFLLLEEGTGIEITAPGEELTVLPPCEEEAA